MNTDFRLVYQPKVKNEMIIGLEALLRPNNHRLTPFEYISSVSSKLYLDHEVLSKVMDDLKCYKISIPVSINIHPSSLCDERFLARIINTKNIIIELVEYEDFLLSDDFYVNVKIIQNNGILVSLDDFGVDFSTMDNALLLAPDQIKFDISLINGIENSYSKYRYLYFLYSKVSSLCTKNIVFEGVETIEQKFLIELFCECPTFQGFYYYKPMDLSELIEIDLFDYPIIESEISEHCIDDKFEYDMFMFVTKHSKNFHYTDDLNDFIKKKEPLGLVYNKDVRVSVHNVREIYYSTQNAIQGGALSLVRHAENSIVMRNDEGVVVFDNLEHQRLTGGSIVGKTVESVIKLNENYKICIEKDKYLLSLSEVNFFRDIEVFDGIEYETVREKLLYNDRNFIVTTIRPLDVRSSNLNVDELTGCFTRSYFRTNLTSFSNKTIAFIDLDGFKKVNDILGHRKGDECLISFVSLMTAFLRDDDRLIRYGGDEFVVIFDSLLVDAITSRLEGINRKVKDYFFRQNIDLSFSYGLSNVEKDNIYEALEIADRHMYVEKNRKKSVAKQ
ncbi:GGDEF domain-containing protein [Vibrio scophthalmi]|uniref:GGDEF domain-containing protein n=1 Tax=Vibrio scophthalmi TaxID=45658 RepID=UPI003EBA9F84